MNSSTEFTDEQEHVQPQSPSFTLFVDGNTGTRTEATHTKP